MELEKLWGDMTPTYFFKVELPDGIEVFCWLVEGLEATGDFKQVTLSRAKVMDYWEFLDWGVEVRKMLVKVKWVLSLSLIKVELFFKVGS